MRNILLVFLLSWAISDTFGQVQFLGSPTTTVRNRGNFVSDSLFYLPKRQKLPSDTGAIRYAIADSSVYVWTGYQWNKLQPGAFVAISDTASMLSPYTRGSGTTNYIPKFTGTRTFGNSVITDNGSKVTIGALVYPAKLYVQEASDSNAMIARLARSNAASTDNSQIEFFADPVNNTATIRATGSSAASLIFESASTEIMRMTTAGNVGIGNTSPSQKLDVSGTIVGQKLDVTGIITITPTAASSSYMLYKQAGNNLALLGSDAAISGATDTDFGIYVYGANNLDFWTNAGRRMRLNSSGELLISTTTDAGAYAMQVAGDIYNTGNAVLAQTSGSVGIGTTTFNSKLNILHTSLGISHVKSVGGYFYSTGFNTNNPFITYYSQAHFVIGYGESTGGAPSVNTLVMTNAGNVGIGTTSISERLQVNGNGVFAGTVGVNTSGQTRKISTYYGANSDGSNIYIGDGGQSSIGAIGETFKGSRNTSIGVDAMYSNTTGYENSAIGRVALYSNTTGDKNAADGYAALYSNTTGYRNSALGGSSLFYVTSGTDNIGIGANSGWSPSDNISNKRITTDFEMILIGYGATKNSASQLNNSIAVGLNTLVTASNTAMWGNASMSTHIFQSGEMLIGTTSDAGAYALQVNGAIYNTTTLTTGAPTSGTAKPWRLGEAATVSPTSPNRTIRVEIDGVVYYIHAKTTND